MTKQADFMWRARERMYKTRESYAAARAQMLSERRPETDPTWATALHVTNGDSTVPELRATGLAHHILCWRDALHEGPVPDVPEDEASSRPRALPGREDAADLGTADELAERDHAPESHRDGEYVLWFEADLYDQLQVIQIVARLHALDVAADRTTLICIGEHPGIAHFGGLGELDADQLGRLPAMAATPLTTAALEHATRRGRLFLARIPAGSARSRRRPYASCASCRRGLRSAQPRIPSTRDGLSLTERRILAAVAEGAPTAGAAFLRIGAREARPFLGDSWAYEAMTRLPVPPTRCSGRADRSSRRQADPADLTGVGRRVLDGRADHLALNGIDRWIGGVPSGPRRPVALERGHGDGHRERDRNEDEPAQLRSGTGRGACTRSPGAGRALASGTDGRHSAVVSCSPNAAAARGRRGSPSTSPSIRHGRR